MSMQDPISDLITCVKNAQMAGHMTVTIPSSKHKKAILALLAEEGFIEGYDTLERDAKEFLKIKLKYFAGKPVIEEFKRVSKPSLRRYTDSKTIPTVNGGLGVALISTSKGLMTDKQAKAHNIGGEVICSVY